MNSLPENSWILTVTGKHLYPLNPRVEDIDIRDIAYALAGEQRFSNFCYPRYTVAQHSHIVSMHVSKENALAGLLHDASEGLGLRDIAKPLKNTKAFEEYRFYEEKLMATVAKKFNFQWPLDPEIKKIDKLLLQDETKYLMCGKILSSGGPSLNLPYIHPWSAEMAEALFLMRFRELWGDE
jgi:hypothetical protein